MTLSRWFSITSLFSFVSLSLVTQMGEWENPESHVMANFQQPHSDVPSSCYSIYVTRSIGWGGLMGALLARDLFLHTHAHLARRYTTETSLLHTHPERNKCVGLAAEPGGMTVRNACPGLWLDTSRCLSRCQWWETLKPPRRALARGWRDGAGCVSSGEV